jgi:hypothetical protein
MSNPKCPVATRCRRPSSGGGSHRAAFREVSSWPMRPVRCLVLASSALAVTFHEGLWCYEGFIAWEHQQPFLIMDLSCGDGTCEADGAKDDRYGRPGHLCLADDGLPPELLIRLRTLAPVLGMFQGDAVRRHDLGRKLGVTDLV